MKKNKLKNNSGFATIPTILAVCAMILIVALGIAAATFTETVSSSADLQSSAAIRAAEAGAHDALMRIARNKNYSCVSTDCYSLDLQANGCSNNIGCAKVTVSSDPGTAGSPKIITVKGIVQNKTRVLQAQVIFDSSGYGQLNNVVWQEITN
jgi:hypothetical protein